MELREPSVYLVLLFISANLLGLAAGVQLYGTPGLEEVSTAYQSPASGAVFFGVLLLATVLLLALYRYDKEFLVRAWFGLAVLMTSLILFEAFLPLVPALVLTAGLFALRSWSGNSWLRNALDTVPFAGAGALFGTVLSLRSALVFAALLAVYDYVAVNRTGHMVKLAEQGLESGTLMGFQYPKGEVQDAEAPRDSIEKGGKKVGMLGGGDVITPMVIAVSVIPLFGIGAAVSTVAGSAFALFLFFTVIPRGKNRFYPAIPVVGSGALLGLVLHLALSLL